MKKVITFPYLHGGILAYIPSELLLQAPCPAALHAATLNSYWLFSCSPLTLYVRSGIVTFVARVHLSSPNFRFSNTYPVTGLPPSERGFVQDNVMESVLVSTEWGIPGGPGGSKRKELQKRLTNCAKMKIYQYINKTHT